MQIDSEELLKLCRSQASNVELWYGQFERHRDGASVRNASIALGKWFGQYGMIMAVLGKRGEDVPSDLFDLAEKFSIYIDNVSNVFLQPRPDL